MTPARLRSLSLSARIMAIVVGAAILPLALIGAWLAASGARAGRELLGRELSTSLEHVSQRVRDRWIQRSAELNLLANNAPARRLLSATGADPEAAAYLEDLARALRLSMREFTYKDARGGTRWSTNEATLTPTGALDARVPAAGFNLSDAVRVRRPVVGDRGDTLGVVEARVLLSAILPNDSVQAIVAGAALRIRNREDGEVIGGVPPSASAAGLVATQSSLSEPPLDLSLAASDARYVEPFARAARIGLAFLVVVAVLALGLTAFLTRRLTGSLEQMADAAGAVAAGDLARTVTGRGGREIEGLASAFNTMTESLRRSLHELSRREALAAVGQFAAAISHEVRNSLTSVRLDLQRLAERAAAADDRKLIHRMLRNVRRLDSIVTGSLRVARSHPDSMRSVLGEGVVRSALTAAEPVFNETGTKAELVASDNDRARVRGDAGALEQMLLNLLINAAQAMVPGGIARVSIDVDGETVVVRVADDGPGIPPETLARLGEAFFSSRPEGTGLGFAIARQIAAAHGGDVCVESTGPTGTVVRVTLPRERAAGGVAVA